MYFSPLKKNYFWRQTPDLYFSIDQMDLCGVLFFPFHFRNVDKNILVMI